MQMMSIFSLHTSVPCFRLCGGDSAAPGCMGEQKIIMKNSQIKFVRCNKIHI